MTSLTSDQLFEHIKEIYFFEYLDKGIPPQDTPLFRHIAGEDNLCPALMLAGGIPQGEAARLLQAAYEEVKL